jgi:hypothetical protein
VRARTTRPHRPCPTRSAARPALEPLDDEQRQFFVDTLGRFEQELNKDFRE